MSDFSVNGSGKVLTITSRDPLKFKAPDDADKFCSIKRWLAGIAFIARYIVSYASLSLCSPLSPQWRIVGVSEGMSSFGLRAIDPTRAPSFFHHRD